MAYPVPGSQVTQHRTASGDGTGHHHFHPFGLVFLGWDLFMHVVGAWDAAHADRAHMHVRWGSDTLLRSKSRAGAGAHQRVTPFERVCATSEPDNTSSGKLACTTGGGTASHCPVLLAGPPACVAADRKSPKSRCKCCKHMHASVICLSVHSPATMRSQ